MRKNMFDLTVEMLRHYTEEIYSLDDQIKDPKLKVKQFNKYLDRMLVDGIPYKPNTDPINIYRLAHDQSIIELKHELTKVIGDKKTDALPLAIKIFNQIQDKAVKSTRIQINSSAEKVDGDEDNMNEQLEQFDILLNDPSSPIISKIRSSSKYATEKLPETIDQYRSLV